MQRFFLASSSALLLIAVAACSGPANNPDSGSTTDAGTGGNIDGGAACPDGGTDGGDTWCNYAAGFFVSYCTDCHNSPGSPGNPPGNPIGDMDWRYYANVQPNGDRIRCGVSVSQDPAWVCGSIQPKQFPAAAPYPTDAERNRLVGWIDAGMPY